MKYIFGHFIIPVLFSIISLTACKPQQQERYVVVLSMDGFRNEYIERANTPTLDSIAKTGVRSSFIPCFPSITFPNHYSMATGLYPDHHGLVSNSFYADDLDSIYRIGDRNAVENPAFYKGEPIWITAEKQNIRTASFYWVGSETPIQGRQPSIWKKFNNQVPFENRADSVLNWLSLPEDKRPHLIMWYMEEPDAIGHRFTPDSIQPIEMIEKLDKQLSRFFLQTRQLPIFDKIDFIIVSDHGMATYYPENYINLADYLPRDSFNYIFDGTVTLLYPKKSYTDSAYAILQRVPHIQAWHKTDVPSRYIYGTNSRIGDLVVLADSGTMVHFRDIPDPKSGGAHGYDNFHPDMRAIFYATGPSFKQNYTQGAMPNVNLYPLIARLLGITPASNDGNIAEIEQLLK